MVGFGVATLISSTGGYHRNILITLPPPLFPPPTVDPPAIQKAPPPIVPSILPRSQSNGATRFILPGGVGGSALVISPQDSAVLRRFVWPKTGILSFRAAVVVYFAAVITPACCRQPLTIHSAVTPSLLVRYPNIHTHICWTVAA